MSEPHRLEFLTAVASTAASGALVSGHRRYLRAHVRGERTAAGVLEVARRIVDHANATGDTRILVLLEWSGDLSADEAVRVSQVFGRIGIRADQRYAAVPVHPSMVNEVMLTVASRPSHLTNVAVFLDEYEAIRWLFAG